MVKVIFLNGPPRCGKDTLAEQICFRNNGTYHIKMAAPLKVGCYNLFFGVNDHKLSPWEVMDAVEGVKEKKVLPDSEETWRQFLIDTSEKHMKPIFGEDIFGRIVRDSIKRIEKEKKYDKFVVSDSGFVDEALPLVYEFGPENCVLIRLRRDKCTFQGDSRSYIDLEDYGVKGYDIYNNSTIENCYYTIQEMCAIKGIL